MVTIIVDEIGDPGLDTPNDPDFFMTATIIEKPTLFGRISAKFREQFGRTELKSKDINRSKRGRVLKEISELDLDVYAVYIDKGADDNPEWWTKTFDRRPVFRMTLSELMDETFSKTEKNYFFVIIDSNQDIMDGVGEQIVKGSAKNNNKDIINVKVEDSTDETYGDLIQTNDVIPREARDRKRGRKERHGIRINIRRLKGG
ncbi:MAG: hypothetical protein FWD37_03900 [Methanomassiliicoccaceae archaeon]|nr:hypothetical protein [Methanomassiliicoccaceae archaeon]